MNDLSQPALRPHFRLTVEAFHRMGEHGILGEDDRVELIEGELIAMAPIGSKHAGMVNRLARLLTLETGNTAVVSIQNPLWLDEHNEPQPDLMLLAPRPDDYREQLPQPAAVLLLIEVADSTIDHDRDVKIPLFAKHGVAEVWLVDLRRECVVAYRKPEESVYAEVTEARRSDSLTPTLLPQIRIVIDQLFA